VDNEGKQHKACLFIDETSQPSIELQSDIFNSGKINCEKLFEGFQDLHKLLDDRRFKLLCMGYRYDVYPSGMALSMGHGTLAYVHILGQPATQLVDLFEPTNELESIVSYEEQISYKRKWADSLR
jgi:hypothetical protein